MTIQSHIDPNDLDTLELARRLGSLHQTIATKLGRDTDEDTPLNRNIADLIDIAANSPGVITPREYQILLLIQRTISSEAVID